MQLFSTSFQMLEKAMSTATLKQRVISSNISNVDTPNYKSKQVDFESFLTNAMNTQTISSHRSNAMHLPFSTEATQFNPKVTVNSDTLLKPNGNNVDMDYEMSELAKNQLWFNALTERVNGNFNTLRTVINDGR